jgi:hybrid cluster-associated redox disulfide protein
MSKKTLKTPLSIDKKINLSQLLGLYPHLAPILVTDYGLHCIGCGMAAFETLEAGAKAHGMSDKKIDSMVKHLNQLTENKTITPKI